MTDVEFQKALKFIAWLANDCGGCEVCGRAFSRYTYDEYELMLTQMTPEQLAQVTTDHPNPIYNPYKETTHDKRAHERT